MAEPSIDIPVEFRPFDISNKAEVEMLAKWSFDSGEMIPLTTEVLAGHQFATAAYVGEELAGYSAVTNIFSRYVIELGGLLVNPEYRKHHIGSRMVKKVVEIAREEFEPERIIAFGNEKSSPLFVRLGGTPVSDVASLHPEVWKPCIICPRYEAACDVGKRCCDRVIDITSISTE